MGCYKIRPQTGFCMQMIPYLYLPCVTQKSPHYDAGTSHLNSQATRIMSQISLFTL